MQSNIPVSKYVRNSMDDTLESKPNNQKSSRGRNKKNLNINREGNYINRTENNYCNHETLNNNLVGTPSNDDMLDTNVSLRNNFRPSNNDLNFYGNNVDRFENSNDNRYMRRGNNNELYNDRSIKDRFGHSFINNGSTTFRKSEHYQYKSDRRNRLHEENINVSTKRSVPHNKFKCDSNHKQNRLNENDISCAINETIQRGENKPYLSDRQNRSYVNDNNVESSRVMRNNSRSYKGVYRGISNKNYYDRSNNIKIKTTQNETNHKSSIEISNLDQREFLIHELNLSHYECMICINAIQKDSSVWSCVKCYHIFHLHCIKKWAHSIDKKQNTPDEIICWRCPACQNENDNVITSKLFYSCFCGKQINPPFKYGTTPHSCGDVCAQSNKSNTQCLHLCSLQCHPGPCPPCNASVTRPCHCGVTRITARCIADESQFQCQAICGKIMKCGVHKCEKQCHIDDGHRCQITLEQKCWCDNSNRSLFCGSEESTFDRYECGGVCNRIKNCDNHKCELLCHEGNCEECDMMPDKVKNCCCGKITLQELSQVRMSCLDSIATCDNVCGKGYLNCEHKCTNLCHNGSCKPCPNTSARNCRCKSAIITAQCDSTDVVQCRKRCNEKLLCGRHRCEKQCCDSEVHMCQMNCGRQLSCKQHRCELECGHPGICAPCHNVSFEELFCRCGTTFILPPIACGTQPPICSQLCSRDHNCQHLVRHNCHSEADCPPCTELVNKPCPGGHSEFSNVPCFRPVATCGLPCGKPQLHCDHSCVKPCHVGPCVEDEQEMCKQPCVRLRKDCQHPCNASCHKGDCEQVSGKCTKELVLTCECTLRTSVIVCDKLKHINALLRSENAVSSSLDVQISAKDGLTYLTCNNICKRAARNCRLAEAFNKPIPLCVLYTYYPDSIKAFGSRNKNYVIFVQNILIRLQNGFVSTTKNSHSETISPVTYDQAQFIQRYAECFNMKWQCHTDNKGRWTIEIEASRGTSRVPKPLLLEVLKETYPHLFTEAEPEKDKPTLSSAIGSLSFADRLKLNTK